MSRHDVIIVGARCGGAATAMLLARRGMNVLVLERNRRGSDKLSTLYIHQPGVARLRSWGVLPAIEATGAPPHHSPVIPRSGCAHPRTRPLGGRR